jgi:hypothetical protein
MKFPIGAMSIGDIFDRGIKLLIAKLFTFYGITLIVLFPIFVAQVYLEILQIQAQAQTAEAGNPGAALIASSIGLGLLVLLALILQPIVTAATLHVISQEFADQRITVWQALAFAFRRFLAILGTSLLVGLILGVVASICFIAAGIAIGLGLAMAGPLSLVISVPLALMFQALWVLMFVWYALCSQVVVVEGMSAIRAMNRSKQVSKGYRWRLFGVLALIMVLYLIPVSMTMILQLVLKPVETVQFGQQVKLVPNLQNVIINQVIGTLLNTLVATYAAVCSTLFYFDLRIRKEGFDLELAAKEQAVAPS